MKNITLTVDDQVYRKARLLAAQRDTSVSAMVRDYIESLAETGGGEDARVRRMDELFARTRAAVGKRVPREELHDRRGLR